MQSARKQCLVLRKQVPCFVFCALALCSAAFNMRKRRPRHSASHTPHSHAHSGPHQTADGGGSRASRHQSMNPHDSLLSSGHVPLAALQLAKQQLAAHDRSSAASVATAAGIPIMPNGAAVSRAGSGGSSAVPASELPRPAGVSPALPASSSARFPPPAHARPSLELAHANASGGGGAGSPPSGGGMLLRPPPAPQQPLFVSRALGTQPGEVSVLDLPPRRLLRRASHVGQHQDAGAAGGAARPSDAYFAASGSVGSEEQQQQHRQASGGLAGTAAAVLSRGSSGAPNPQGGFGSPASTLSGPLRSADVAGSAFEGPDASQLAHKLAHGGGGGGISRGLRLLASVRTGLGAGGGGGGKLPTIPSEVDLPSALASASATRQNSTMTSPFSSRAMTPVPSDLHLAAYGGNGGADGGAPGAEPSQLKPASTGLAALGEALDGAADRPSDGAMRQAAAGSLQTVAEEHAQVGAEAGERVPLMGGQQGAAGQGGGGSSSAAVPAGEAGGAAAGGGLLRSLVGALVPGSGAAAPPSSDRLERAPLLGGDGATAAAGPSHVSPAPAADGGGAHEAVPGLAARSKSIGRRRSGGALERRSLTASMGDGVSLGPTDSPSESVADDVPSPTTPRASQSGGGEGQQPRAPEGGQEALEQQPLLRQGGGAELQGGAAGGVGSVGWTVPTARPHGQGAAHDAPLAAGVVPAATASSRVSLLVRWALGSCGAGRQ